MELQESKRMYHVISRRPLIEGYCMKAMMRSLIYANKGVRIDNSKACTIRDQHCMDKENVNPFQKDMME